MGGIGRLKGAPGTWASAFAVPAAYAIVLAGGPAALGLAALAVFALGWWASAAVERAAGALDPPEVVVDEVAGQWLALLALPPEPLAYGLAFVLFRAADILKPWPASWVDRRLTGGLAIMLDDVVAAAYAAAGAAAVLYWLPSRYPG